MQSSKANNQIQEEEEEKIKVLSVDKLQQQFLSLQQDWETFKKSNPRTRKPQESSHKSSITTFSYSSSSITSGNYSNLMVKTLHLIDQNSPRNLMSSLQSKNNDHHIKNHLMIDSEVREIIRGRREAIERGSLKGRRRLFESYEGLEDNHENNCLVQGVHEVRSALSFDESDGENDDVLGPGEIDDVHAVLVRRYSCSLSDERVERSEVLKERKEMNGKRSSYKNNNNVALYNGCFVFVVVLCVLFSIFILIRSFGVFSIGETKVILVPT